jgi:hypothetical protein
MYSTGSAALKMSGQNKNDITTPMGASKEPRIDSIIFMFEQRHYSI